MFLVKIAKNILSFNFLLNVVSFFIRSNHTKKSLLREKKDRMTTKQLIEQIKIKKSFLCIGLDVDLNKIPQHLLKEEDPIFAFNKAIIDATHHLCVAYKPNTAFYEAYGIKGWKS